MATYRVGVVLRGKRVEMGVLEGGSVLGRRVFQCEGVPSAEKLMDTLCDHLEDLLLKRGLMPGDVEHIGMAVEGVVDSASGVALYTPGLLERTPAPLASLMQGRVDVLPVLMQENWAIATAEQRFGGMQAQADWLCVNAGRSLSGALVLGGRVQLGALGTAGDLAHLRIPQAGEGGCGERLGALASGMALQAAALARLQPRGSGARLTLQELFALAAQGDAEAGALIAQCAGWLARGIAEAIVLLGVDTVVVTGRLSEFGDAFLQPLREALLTCEPSPWATADRVRLLRGTLGQDAALIGAAWGEID